MAKKHWWIVLLLLVVVSAVLLNLRRGEESAASESGGEVDSASTGSHAERGADAKVTSKKDSERPGPVEPIKQRSPEEIRLSLESKAREMMKNGLGGVTDEDKQALTAAIREFEALRAGGLSDQHPGMLVSLAKFSRKLDRLSAYDEVEWRRDAVAFLRSRLSEVESLADGESVEALRERWSREQARDDLPEAIVLRAVRPFGPTSTKKEGLRDALKKWIATFENAAE